MTRGPIGIEPIESINVAMTLAHWLTIVANLERRGEIVKRSMDDYAFTPRLGLSSSGVVNGRYENAKPGASD